MDPSGPSQPSQQSGLNQSQNPASKTTSESTTSQDPSSRTAEPVDHRSSHDVPSQHSQEPTHTALGQGDTGPLKERDISASDAQGYSTSELDGEQMRAPGEGEVADAVKKGGGGGHAEERELAGDMDRKADEHAAALHARGERTGKEIEEEEKEDWTGKGKEVDLGEALGGRGTGVVLAAEE